MQELIRSMELTTFLFVTAVLLGFAGVAIYGGLSERRRAALIKATPTSNIGMAQDGYGEFEGTVEAIDGPPVIAPLTQTPCAWYHARLEKWDRGRRNRDSGYVTVAEATSGAPIMLRDGTGVSLIFPYGAEVTPTDKSQWTGATAVPSDRNPPKVGPAGSVSQGLTISGTGDTIYRYSEERIYIGDPLLVLGEFSRRQFESDEEELDDDNLDDDLDDKELADDEVSGDADVDEADEDDDAGDVFDRALWDDSDRADELTTRGEQTTRACVRRGAGGKPFMITTTPQATHVYMSQMGGQVALYFALLPIGLIALMLYARYS